MRRDADATSDRTHVPVHARGVGRAPLIAFVASCQTPLTRTLKLQRRRDPRACSHLVSPRFAAILPAHSSGMVNGRLPKRGARSCSRASAVTRRSFWPAIGGAAATAANFNQMPIVRNLRKNAADSPRIWTKSARGSEPVFQALLVGCARIRQTIPDHVEGRSCDSFYGWRSGLPTF